MKLVSDRRGFTLIELVIVVAIVGILAAVVLPMAHWSVKRQQEYELQEGLRTIRIAIDRYHDLALAGLIEMDDGDTGYPPSLDVLVEGVELTGDIPAPVPGAVGEYAASGFGLAGGLAGLSGSQASGDGGGFPGVVDAQAGGPAGGDTDPRRGALSGAAGSTMQELRSVLSERAGGGRGGLSDRGARGGRGDGLRDRLGGGGLAARRPATGARGSGGDATADVTTIVLLRRLPIDPFTGDSDWGTRCYGDSIDDRSWCGRNVFDVYSNSRGRGMDGRPYREW